LNGDTYYGEYRGGKRHGHGLYTHISGAVYDGEYIDGLKDGQGQMTYPDGAVYVGQFKAGKREGAGKYTYANGEIYDGLWRDDLKHGAGVYHFLTSLVLTGVWANGHVLHGKLVGPDGTSFVGTFQATAPNGGGLFTFASGLTEAGAFEGGKWIKDGFRKPLLPSLKAPNKLTAPLLHQAARAVTKSIFKRDHFEQMHQLKRRKRDPAADPDYAPPPLLPAAHCPNFRQAGDTTVFLCAQPTLSGLVRMLQRLSSQGLSHALLVDLRDDPVAYVNDHSYHPRDRRAPNAHLQLPAGLTPEERDEVEVRFAARVSKDVAWRGGELLCYKESFAALPAERKNTELSERVRVGGGDDDDEDEAEGGGVLTYRAAVDRAAEAGGASVELVRAPVSVRAGVVSAAQVDALVSRLREADANTALVMCSRTGRLRAVLGAAVAVLVTAASGAEEEDDAGEEEEEGEAEGRVEQTSKAATGPNLLKSEYECVLRVCALLPEGEATKARVDAAVDAACSEVQNLREELVTLKTSHDTAAAEAQAGIRAEAGLLLAHYVELLLVGGYVRAHGQTDYEVSYAEWRAGEGREAAQAAATMGDHGEFRWV
jgi:hypothetical protein